MEAVDVCGPEAARVKLHAAERPRLRAQPVQPAGVRLDPALDDATGLGQDGAARGEHLVRLGEHLGGEELIDGSASDRGVELSQPELLVQP